MQDECGHEKDREGQRCKIDQHRFSRLIHPSLLLLVPHSNVNANINNDDGRDESLNDLLPVVAGSDMTLASIQYLDLDKMMHKLFFNAYIANKLYNQTAYGF